MSAAESKSSARMTSASATCVSPAVLRKSRRGSHRQDGRRRTHQQKMPQASAAINARLGRWVRAHTPA